MDTDLTRPVPAASDQNREGANTAAPAVGSGAAREPSGEVAPPGQGEPAGMLILDGTALVRTESAQEATAQAVAAQPCAEPECVGVIGPEGYCDTCGAARPDERLHYERDAGFGVAGVCDRGIRHLTNEDALAVAADGDAHRRLALVVSDGVSTAPRSAQASSAAVEAALDVLVQSRSTGLGGMPAALVGALTQRLVTACAAAFDAVRHVSELPPGPPDTSGIPKAGHPACTLVAAVVDGDVAVIASIGDSRAYWVPDSGRAQALRLTTDDSWANEEIRRGVDPAVAERGPHAHTITKWLGIDCPDPAPSVTTLTLTEPGYLVVCSDGLWNYASTSVELADVVALARKNAAPDLQAGEPDALSVASALVDWANGRGGVDNITVALARITATEARQEGE